MAALATSTDIVHVLLIVQTAMKLRSGSLLPFQALLFLL